MKDNRKIALSLVSHGHGLMVIGALESLSESFQSDGGFLRVFLTLNSPEPELVGSINSRSWPFDLQLIYNSEPQGFGANHNHAFSQAQKIGCGQWFLVVNPDVIWLPQSDDFWSSLQDCNLPNDIGLLCPKQVDTQGHKQDYARKLMKPWTLLARLARRMVGLQGTDIAASVGAADWVNGACMVWRAEVFKSLKGFDERYFMYCEDADICLRMRMAGWRMDDVNLAVVHDAQRNTRRNAQHMRWHLASLWRFWTSSVFWRYMWFKYNTKKK